MTITQEERILVNELFARFPYGVIVKTAVKCKVLDMDILNAISSGNATFKILPLLRPLSNMTEEEKEELESISSFYFNNALDAQIQESLKGDNKDGSRILEYVACTKVTDWLLEHHFDIHGLIEKGLAIEATEEMYNFKK